MRVSSMPILAGMAFFGVSSAVPLLAAESWNDEGFVLPSGVAKAIEAAAPARAVVPPRKPRRILVYGRVPTHPESAVACFEAMRVLAKKTGAFDAEFSGDPEVFAAETLAGFDAVVMNNTHEGHPLLPRDFGELPSEGRKAALERESMLQKNLLEFVASGKGIVGIHGALAGVGWREYLEMMGGTYADHIEDRVWVEAEEPEHPLAKAMGAPRFEVRDEIYVFEEPYSRSRVRVILSLDLDRTKDPGKRKDRDYALSWIRRHGKGRIFYSALGHSYEAYETPSVLAAYLAGIQFAVGDLDCDAEPGVSSKAPAGTTEARREALLEPEADSKSDPRPPDRRPPGVPVKETRS